MRHFIVNGILAATLIATLNYSFGADSAPAHAPKAGDKAPTVEANDQNGQPWNLQDALKNGPVLLYFYPKDDTPGCTKEACGLRDRMTDLKKDKVQVVGVSFDPAGSHQEFIKKYNLNFPLLVDTDGKIADRYGVRMAGKNMARRVSFLIDQKGAIRHVTDSPSAETHLAEMKEAVAALAGKSS
jgi:thioredoxin-dependent peroxiredoxin